MAAEINTGRGAISGIPSTLPCASGDSPDLVNKVEVGSGQIHGVAVIPGRDAFVTVSADRSVRVWILRDAGHYWPSVCHYVGAAVTSLHYNHSSGKVFIGLDNGLLSEFNLSEDLNRLDHLKDYHAHINGVAGLHYSLVNKWLLSVAKDKYFQFHCVETGRRLGGYMCNASCTSLEYDEEAKYVFAGDYSGQITVCKLGGDTPNGVQFINILKGHSGSVQSLYWDGNKGWLYSGSYDSTIFVWDIGGRKGTVYELHGHRQKVTGIRYLPHSRKLLSVGEDENLIVWDMVVERKETSDWSESDICQLCKRPFFWNFKAMYDQKLIGLRQHHCRKCGKAVCDGCSTKRSALPIKGHEMPVRLCEECYIGLNVDETKSLAKFYDLKQSVRCADYDPSRSVLVTVDSNHIAKVWNLKTVI